VLLVKSITITITSSFHRVCSSLSYHTLSVHPRKLIIIIINHNTRNTLNTYLTVDCINTQQEEEEEGSCPCPLPSPSLSHLHLHIPSSRFLPVSDFCLACMVLCLCLDCVLCVFAYCVLYCTTLCSFDNYADADAGYS
jgi:hypothetical protein